MCSCFFACFLIWMRFAEGAETGAEAESGDALMKLDALAARLQPLKEVKKPSGEEQSLLEFGDFARGKFAPASRDGSVFSKAVKEELDFGERKVHFAGEADEQHAVQGVGRIAALAAGAFGGREQADAFVVTDGGSGDTGLSGELADFHSGAPRCEPAEAWHRCLFGIHAGNDA